jgi:hypothetical protein
MVLYVFVEGPDDMNFFKKFLENRFPKYSKFEYIQYAQLSLSTLEQIVTTIKSESIDHIYLCDLDFANRGIDFKVKVDEVSTSTKIDKKFIHVVIEEIESWYLAGFNKRFCSKCPEKVYFFEDTQLVTKQSFKSSCRWSSKILLNYLLSNNEQFDFAEARNRNKSFDRFCESNNL